MGDEYNFERGGPYVIYDDDYEKLLNPFRKEIQFSYDEKDRRAREEWAGIRKREYKFYLPVVIT